MAGSWTTLSIDHFNDGSAPGYSGNGTISESGTELEIDGGVVSPSLPLPMSWSVNYVSITAPRVPFVSVDAYTEMLRFECAITHLHSGNAQDDTPAIGMYIGDGQWRNWMFGLTQTLYSDLRVTCWRNFQDLFANAGNGDTFNRLTISASNPVYLRFYWNKNTTLARTTEEGRVLAPGEYALYAKQGSGSYAYQFAPSLALNSLSTGFGLFLRKGSGSLNNRWLPERGRWDYIKLEQWTATSDTTPPTVTNKSPADGAEDIARTATISFSINDDVQVDLSSIILNINGSQIWTGSSPSSWATGWTGSSYAANGSNGYNFSLVPSGSALYTSGSEVTVGVYGEDGDSNAVDTEWTFTVIDTEEPYLTNKNPSPNSTSSFSEQSIEFSINDDIGVDLSSIEIYVRGILIFHGVSPNSWSTGWTTSTYTSNSNNGYDFVLRPTGAAVFSEGEQITVRVLADDST